MKQNSIKENYVYNTLLNVLNIILPMITFPYVARILSPDGLGKINFSISIIQYFVLIAQLGIPAYAIRECAKVRDNTELLTKTVKEILTVNVVSFALSYSFFIFILLSVERLADYRGILLITSINIISSCVGVQWFYQAIEDYKYIIKRNIVIKVVSALLIFIFIKSENDILLYAEITVLSSAFGYLYNFFHLRKHINIFKRFKDYNFKRHLKPIFIFFAMSVSVSIYVSLDKVMLGLLTTDATVGLYTAANKLIKIILAIVTSLGTVLIPRMSYYIEKKDFSQVNKLIKKSLDFLLMMSIPATVGIIALAYPLIRVFVGVDYMEAGLTIRIMSPIILLIGLSNLIGIQVLMTHGKEKYTLISTIVGAVINIIMNIVLIPTLKQNGAAISTLIAEMSVTLVQLSFAYNYMKGNVPWKSLFDYLIGGLLIFSITTLVAYLCINVIVIIVLSMGFSVLIYFGFLYVRKNVLVIEIRNWIRIKLKI